MTSNSDVEQEIAKKLADILRELEVLPAGYRCMVNLFGPTQKKRRNAEFRRNWDPGTDEIRVQFAPLKGNRKAAVEGGVTIATKVASVDPVEGRMLDLVRALDRAESRPGYEFVSLKWFRDAALLHEGFAWASNEAARHDALREAIDRNWIKTRKVANPRPPNFPVTAISLNRLMPEVSTALGGQSGGLPAFRPVKMRGEALSATVLHDRR